MDSNELIQIARECGGLDCVGLDIEISQDDVVFTFWQLEQFAQRIRPQWLPIDSAPKDRRIIVARAGHPWIHVCYWSTRWNHWANGPSAMDYFAAPTHWMESIAPPEGNP